MSNLHPHQIKILNLLKENPEGSLSLNDIKEAIGAKTRSLIQHHISQLEKKKYLYINPGNSRDFKILKDPSSLYTFINVYGSAQCGFSGSLVSNNPIDRIPISPSIINFDISKAFMVLAQGDSMKPKINSGDRLIVEQTNILEKKRIHICSLNGEVLVKKVFEDEDKLSLVSINEEFAPKIIFKKDIQENNVDFFVEGIVRSKIDYDFS